MKKINILIIFIAIFFFTYGFDSHKFQIFPYKTIVELKNLIKNLINKDENKFKLDDENFNKIIKEQNKVRDEYPQWSDKIRLIKYYPGLNIFSDRNYYNHFNDNFLEKMYLLQIPRHHQKNLKIVLSHNTMVFRIICNSNENDLNGWKKMKSSILIISSTCIHQEIYQKYFDKGKHIFEHGGPISADPIFFEINDLNDIKIIN